MSTPKIYYTIKDFELYPYYDYLKLPEGYNPYEKYLSQAPVKGWINPAANPDSMVAQQYTSFNSVTGLFSVIWIPDYIAGVYNIPTPEWAVTTTGRNMMEYPIPVNPKLPEMIEGGYLRLENKGGTWQIVDVAAEEEANKDKPPTADIAFEIQDREMITKTLHIVESMYAFMQSSFKDIFKDLSAIESHVAPTANIQTSKQSAGRNVLFTSTGSLPPWSKPK